MKLVTFAASLLFLTSCKPQISLKSQTSLEIIRKAQSVDESRVGFGANRTKTYNAFLAFKKESSKEELLKFSDDSNVNVRAYAAKALREKFPEENFFDLLLRKLKDESSVIHFDCCFRTTMTIGDFYFQQFHERLTYKQRSIICDKLLNVNHQHHEALSRLLAKWKIPNNHLPRIRELLKEGKRTAIIALARIGKEEDFPTIIAAEEAHTFLCYYAIEINPHPIFFDLLQQSYPKRSTGTCRRQFFLAIAAFKNQKALTLLNQAFEEGYDNVLSKKHHCEDLKIAITAHSSPIYADLQKRLEQRLP